MSGAVAAAPIKLGEVTISRVIEIDRSSFPTASMLPESTPAAIAKHDAWLRPHFYDAATGDLGSRIGSYIVRTPHHTVIIDTGVGNDKNRDGAAAWHMRKGNYLADLEAAGVKRDDVDLVLLTHLHIDHVGWNTCLIDGKWRPTFPNARYIFAGEEFEFWKHESGKPGVNEPCIADSVLPIADAGQAVLVDGNYVVDEYLRFEPSPGHTPGHVCVRLRTSAGEAVFSGDVMHRTVQVAEFQWNSRFCGDPVRARAAREAFVTQYADSGVLVLAAHFTKPGYIVRRDGGYRFEPAEPAAV